MHAGVDTRRTANARTAVIRAVATALGQAGVYYSMPPAQPFPDAPAAQGTAQDDSRA